MRRKERIIIGLIALVVFMGIATFISYKRAQNVTKTEDNSIPTPTVIETSTQETESVPTTTPKVEVTITPEPTEEPVPTSTPEEVVNNTTTPLPIVIIENTPTPQPSNTPTPIPSPTPTPTPTPLPTPSPTPTPTPTPTPAPLSKEGFISDLMVALGYTDTSMEKAIEVGLILKGEYNSLTYIEPITNKEVARIAVRAIEDENIKYPDYLDAYKGLITDWADVESDYRNDILKAVYTGILPLNNDGAVKPKDRCKGDSATNVIGNIVNPSSRDEVAVFATPDAEFEVFMNSSEASNYVSMQNISRVVDGKVIYDMTKWGGIGESLVPAWHNKEINKIAYEATKTLVQYARQNGNYVFTCYDISISKPNVFLEYFENKKLAYGPIPYGQFSVSFDTRPARIYPFFRNLQEQKEDTYYYWTIGKLFDDEDAETHENLYQIGFKTDEYINPLKALFKAIYGNTIGNTLFNHAMAEYDKEREYLLADEEYYNWSLIYFPEFNNMEVQNRNDEGMNVVFGTSKP